MVHQTTLLRIMCDRRVTKVPYAVFRELRSRSTSASAIRGRLGGGPLARLQAIWHMAKWLKGERITRHDGRYVLNTFLPPFPGGAFDRLFTNLLGERPWVPVSAYMAITAECPARCWHCSIKRRTGEPATLEDRLRAIDGLNRLGVSLFGITGGEPLVCPHLARIVEAIATGGGEAMLFTAGFGLTLERARELKRLGLWAVCVSLDRVDPEEIDVLRGCPGAGRAAFDALTAAVGAGLYTCVNCVADRNTVETKRYLRLYRKAAELGVHEFRLIEPMPCGNLVESPDSVFLTPEQTSELRRFHRRTNAKWFAKTKVCSFNEMESPELFGCAGGTRHLFIDPAGEVCPCDFTPLSFGNICREPVEDIFDRMSAAMKRPRRLCMIRHHRELIRRALESGTPAPMEVSLETVERLPEEPLPDFVKWSRF